MTVSSPSTTVEHQFADPAQDQKRGRHSRRRGWLAATGAVVVAAAAAAAAAVVAVADPFSAKHPASTGVTDNAYPTSLASVTRQEITSQTEVSATLGYSGSYTVVDQAGGTASSSASGSSGTASSGGGGSTETFTDLPSVGQVVSQGQVLYRVNNSPVVLLYGTTPAWRSLSEGMTGPDVTELNADLVALGYATRGQLDPSSDVFSAETAAALEKFQAALDVTKTGTLTLGQAIFVPTAARVTSLSATLGGPAQSGSTVLQATSTTRQVSIALDTSEQTDVAVGDKVTITLPNGQTTPGVVSSVGTVASNGSGSSSNSSSSGSSNSNSGSSSSNPTITVLVNPTDPAATGTWDQAPVNVTITTATASNALVVPINALLARPGGGYAVEVVGPGGIHHLVDVSLGIFDDADGLVQVTGSGLSAGQHVVVPNL